MQLHDVLASEANPAQEIIQVKRSPAETQPVHRSSFRVVHKQLYPHKWHRASTPNQTLLFITSSTPSCLFLPTCCPSTKLAKAFLWPHCKLQIAWSKKKIFSGQISSQRKKLPHEAQHIACNLKHSHRRHHEANDRLCSADALLSPSADVHFPQHSSWPMLGDLDTKNLPSVCALATPHGQQIVLHMCRVSLPARRPVVLLCAGNRLAHWPHPDRNSRACGCVWTRTHDCLRATEPSHWPTRVPGQERGAERAPEETAQASSVLLTLSNSKSLYGLLIYPREEFFLFMVLRTASNIDILQISKEFSNYELDGLFTVQIRFTTHADE